MLSVKVVCNFKFYTRVTASKETVLSGIYVTENCNLFIAIALKFKEQNSLN